jgi:protein-L-isoaspartate(D-aspartate) O-methyltransferase
MEPRVLARLVQEATVGEDDVALDIGCGYGYSTALLARLAGTAVGIESDPEMAARATELLLEIETDNALVVEGPLNEGYPSQAPYDVILIGGAVAAVPDAILDQLAEGGRLVTVVDRADGVGDAVILRKTAGLISRRVLFDAAVPLLPGFERKPSFTF